MKDRYSIVRPIAAGGFGRVSLALDHETGEHVAIKELINFDADSLSRFVNEYRILYEHIDNEYVVDVIDADFDATPPYIVLEYCEEGSLRKWVHERKPWRVVVFALSYALQGLEGLHRLSGFHRDLKPENILVAKDAERGFIVKVADFGLARVPRTLSPAITTHAMGTMGYIAPEVLNGSAGFHPGADIYSLGVVALELLTGGKNPAAIHGAEIPAELRRLVLDMLGEMAKRPNVRNIAARLATIISLPDLPVPTGRGATPQPVVPPEARASGPAPRRPDSPPGAPRKADPPPVVVAPSAVSTPGPRASTGPGLGTIAGVAAAATGLGILLGKLAGGDSSWDASVKRRRGDSDGQFKKGGRFW